MKPLIKSKHLLTLCAVDVAIITCALVAVVVVHIPVLPVGMISMTAGIAFNLIFLFRTVQYRETSDQPVTNFQDGTGLDRSSLVSLALVIGVTSGAIYTIAVTGEIILDRNHTSQWISDVPKLVFGVIITGICLKSFLSSKAART